MATVDDVTVELASLTLPSQICDMLRWQFNTYVHPSGRAEVQSDIDRLGDYGIQDFSVKVKYLAATTLMSDWSVPQAKKLAGHDGLYEIRFKAGNNATRAIGYFGPTAHHFTILIICTHKQNVYKPADAIKTAAKRRKQIAEGIAACQSLTLDGEEFPPAPET